MLLELISGPILGGLFGIFNAWMAHRQKVSDQKHELEVMREERETRKVEAEMNLMVTDAEFSGKAFLEAQKAGNRTALSSTALNTMLNGGVVLRFLGGILAFMLGMTDVGKGVIRPGMTIYLGLFVTNMLTEYSSQVGGLGLETRISLVHDISLQLVSLFMTVAMYWFGERHMANRLAVRK